MKSAGQSITFGLIALLLIGVVFSIDIAFYRFPAVIKVFAHERELLVGLALLAQAQALKNIWQRCGLAPLKLLKLLGISIGSMVVVTLGLYLIGGRFLNLWDDNPFLAEYPVIWNIFSPLLTVVVFGLLVVQLLIVSRLIFTGDDKRMSRRAYGLTAISILCAIGMNFIENRYVFQPLVVFSPIVRQGGIVLAGLFSLIIGFSCRHWHWLFELRARQKYALFGIGLLLLIVVSLLFFSRLLHPIYAYSITAKALVLAGLEFMLLFGIFFVITVLLQLPGAKVAERLQNQTQALRSLDKLTGVELALEEKVARLLECCVLATQAAGGWGELPTAEQKAIVFPPMQKEIEESVQALQLSKHLELSTSHLIIQDLRSDPRCAAISLIPVKWRSLLLLDLNAEIHLPAVLCLVKNQRHGFTANDWQLLRLLVMRARQCWGGA